MPNRPQRDASPNHAEWSRIDELRAQIDGIDAELVALIARRRGVVERLAELKRAAGREAVDPNREDALRASWRKGAEARGLPPEVALGVLEAVLRESRAHVEGVIASSDDASESTHGSASPPSKSR